MTAEGALPPIVSRLAAVALLAALLAAVGLFAVAPFVERAARIEAEIAAARELAEGFERRLASAPASGPRRAAAAEDAFLPGATDALAAAAAQSRIALLAAEEGAELRSVEPRAAPAGAAAIRVALEGPYAAVVRVLRRIETETPVLFIERLELAARAGTDDVAAALDLSGRRRPEVAP